MDSIIINGGKPLIGDIHISGSKNASLPIMAASLLTDGILDLTNIPLLSDINTMKQLLGNHGTSVDEAIISDELNIKLQSKNITNLTAPYEIVRKMRASIWVLGPLLARFGEAKVSLPGGCAIGARQVDLHIAALEAMGATITIEEGYIHAYVKKRLKACEFAFTKSSVGATINTILAAVLADGTTGLSNCAREPEITDLCRCLVKMGAIIDGIGTGELKITGKTSLSGCAHRVLPDRIEAGTYMIAAAMTRGDVRIHGIDYDIVENLSIRMKEAGIDITHYENIVPLSVLNQADEFKGELAQRSNLREHKRILKNSSGSFKNGNGIIHVTHKGPIKPIDISTGPYPGFSTDLQAQFMSLMTISTGSSVIAENIFENRFMHVPELCRMGAHITINGHTAVIRGVDSLSGAEVMASDLRASVSLVIAGLVATGETKIRRIYHLDRGYQAIEKKLAACGADIKRVPGDSV
jgi:UDP-N-acetylglucosamine 1-carboxyvinyltransferase